MLSPAAVLGRITGAFVAIGGLAFAFATGLSVLQDGLMVAMMLGTTSAGNGNGSQFATAMYAFFLVVDAAQIIAFVFAAGLGATGALRAGTDARAGASMALAGAVLCLFANSASVFHIGGMFCGLGMLVCVGFSLILVALASVAFARASNEHSDEEVPNGW